MGHELISLRTLDFEVDDFPTASRKLIAAGIPFAFDITGKGREALAPLVINGRIVDLGRLAVLPRMRVLSAMLALAEVHRRAVVIEPSTDTIRFSVGCGLA